jgi:hypothetical protein
MLKQSVNGKDQKVQNFQAVIAESLNLPQNIFSLLRSKQIYFIFWNNESVYFLVQLSFRVEGTRVIDIMTDLFTVLVCCVQGVRRCT